MRNDTKQKMQNMVSTAIPTELSPSSPKQVERMVSTAIPTELSPSSPKQAERMVSTVLPTELSPSSPKQVEQDSPSSASNQQTNTLWMGAIQMNWSEDFVYSLFANSHGVKSVKIIRHQQFGAPSGYAFIEFDSHESAEMALDTLNGRQIPGTNVIFRLNWGSGGQRKHNGQTEYSLFVGDLSEEVTDPMLLKAFEERFPSTNTAKVITDNTTGLSKRYGFVRFLKKDECDEALRQMNGVIIGSRPVRVDHATARRSGDMSNPMTQAAAASSFPLGGATSTGGTVFVGNLDSRVTDQQLRAHFECCGAISSVKIPPGKGCGFVRFLDLQSAADAINDLQGSFLGGSAIRLDWGKSSHANNSKGQRMLSPRGHMVGMAPMGMPMNYNQFQFPQAWQQQPTMYYSPYPGQPAMFSPNIGQFPTQHMPHHFVNPMAVPGWSPPPPHSPHHAMPMAQVQLPHSPNGPTSPLVMSPHGPGPNGVIPMLHQYVAVQAVPVPEMHRQMSSRDEHNHTEKKTDSGTDDEPKSTSSEEQPEEGDETKDYPKRNLTNSAVVENKPQVDIPVQQECETMPYDPHGEYPPANNNIGRIAQPYAQTYAIY